MTAQQVAESGDPGKPAPILTTVLLEPQGVAAQQVAESGDPGKPAPILTTVSPEPQVLAGQQVAESGDPAKPAPILTTVLLEPQGVGTPAGAVETTAAATPEDQDDQGKNLLPAVVTAALSAVSAAASLPTAIAEVPKIAAAIVNAVQSSAPSTPVALPGSAATRPVAAPVMPPATAGNAGVNLRGPAAAPTVTPISQSGTPATAAAGEQTPFSVYFSSPNANSGLGQGSSAESAAGILPRMILPAVHGSASNLANSTGANASTQTANAAGNGTSSMTVQPVKGSLPGGQSLGTQSDTAPRRDGLQTSAIATTASAAPAAATAAASTSVAVAAASAATTVAPAAMAATAPVIAGGAVPATPDLPAKLPTPAANGGEASTVPTPPVPVAVLPPGPVQVAQMASRVGQSEMRIGMNTSAFGSVEVRTVVHATDVGLTIGSEKGDLRGLLTNEMPALTSSLQQQNLRLNSVSYTQGFGYSSNNAGSGGGSQQQQSFRPQPSTPVESLGTAEAGNDAVEMAMAGELAYAGGSLSILA